MYCHKNKPAALKPPASVFLYQFSPVSTGPLFYFSALHFGECAVICLSADLFIRPYLYLIGLSLLQILYGPGGTGGVGVLPGGCALDTVLHLILDVAAFFTPFGCQFFAAACDALQSDFARLNCKFLRQRAFILALAGDGELALTYGLPGAGHSVIRTPDQRPAADLYGGDSGLQIAAVIDQARALDTDGAFVDAPLREFEDDLAVVRHCRRHDRIRPVC